MSLKRGYNSFIRRMQFSSSKIHLFIEGKDDLYFYNRIVESIDGINDDVKIYKSDDIPWEGSGKAKLISFFNNLKNDNHLVLNLSGTKKNILFCLDKDIDEIIGQIRNSEHIIYTEYYSYENYLFINSCLYKSIQGTLKIDERKIRSLIPDSDMWRKECANMLKEWIAICIFTKKHCNPSCKNFNLNTSPINDKNGKLIEKKFKEKLHWIKKNSPFISDDDFNKEYNRILKFVQNQIQKDQYDKILPGKWYPFLLDNKIRENATLSKKSLKRDVLLALLNSHLDFEGEWKNYFSLKIKKIYKKCS